MENRKPMTRKQWESYLKSLTYEELGALNNEKCETILGRKMTKEDNQALFWEFRMKPRSIYSVYEYPDTKAFSDTVKKLSKYKSDLSHECYSDRSGHHSGGFRKDISDAVSLCPHLSLDPRFRIMLYAYSIGPHGYRGKVFSVCDDDGIKYKDTHKYDSPKDKFMFDEQKDDAFRVPVRFNPFSGITGDGSPEAFAEAYVLSEFFSSAPCLELVGLSLSVIDSDPFVEIGDDWIVFSRLTDWKPKLIHSRTGGYELRFCEKRLQRYFSHNYRDREVLFYTTVQFIKSGSNVRLLNNCFDCDGCKEYPHQPISDDSNRQCYSPSSKTILKLACDNILRPTGIMV